MTGRLSFEGRVAIVTGAGRGIGRAHARLLAERHAAVVVNDTGRAEDGSGPRDPTVAEAVAAEIEAGGGRAAASAADVTVPEEAAALVATALDAFGSLHAVVNNAGVIRFTPFAETAEEDVRRQLAIDPLGAFNVTRAAWAHLVACGEGRVVFTSSAAAFGGDAEAAYATGKASLVGLARSAAAAGAEHGIRANVVLPYAFTRMTFVGSEIPADERRLRERLVPPERIAPLVAVLAHHACPTSGGMYAVGGGRVCRLDLVETPGVRLDDPTPEAILDHWREVVDPTDSVVVGDLASYTARFYESIPGWNDHAARP